MTWSLCTPALQISEVGCLWLLFGPRNSSFLSQRLPSLHAPVSQTFTVCFLWSPLFCSSGQIFYTRQCKSSRQTKGAEWFSESPSGNGPSPRGPCIQGIRLAVPQRIKIGIKSTGGHNLIWIRGSSSVGKSTLAASIAIRVQDQKRHVIWFRFDRTWSTMIATEAFRRVVVCGLAHQYPSLYQHSAQGHPTVIASSNCSLRKHYPR